jgi:fimbrial chaperone protein
MKPAPLFAFLVLLLGAVTAYAFTLTPISATLTPKGYGMATTFRVENELSNRVAFQVTMITRDMDELGNETHESATNVFTVFPPQGIVAPGQRQNIRLVWKGPSSLTNELAYRIVAEELPVAFDPEPKESHIKLMVRYMGTVYIRPSGARPKLQTVSLVKAAGNSAATNSYELTLRNAGTAHQGLRNCALTLTDTAGRSTVLRTNQLGNVEGQNVLALRTRRFLVTLPDDFKQPDYQAKLQVDE